MHGAGVQPGHESGVGMRGCVWAWLRAAHPALHGGGHGVCGCAQAAPVERGVTGLSNLIPTVMITSIFPPNICLAGDTRLLRSVLG